MCGIAGILFRDADRPVETAQLRAMAAAIAHRGPDAAGYWQAPGIGLAHRRLSIIDLAGGDQPLANEDHSVQVVFNGEIYNYRELRAELDNRGHHFRTNSDTEVLVHLYEEEGVRFVERLRGMFAIALSDSNSRKLILARDRVGIKPLYYYRDEEQFLFGSELKSLLVQGGIPRNLNPSAINSYLALGFLPGEQSIFEGVHKLNPGHTLEISPENFLATPKRFWSFAAGAIQPHRSEAEWVEQVSAKLDETVAAHTLSDVPVGAFLSGGLDSSSIVAEMVEQGRPPAAVFTIGFDDSDRNEIPYARLVAKQLGCPHIEEIVSPRAAESLDDLVRYYDEPFADSSAIPTMLVSQLAAQHVKVVLSGDGGDEAFGGYSRYVHDLREDALRGAFPAWMRRALFAPAAQLWPRVEWLPRPLRWKNLLTNLSLPTAEAYANTLTLCRQPLRNQLLLPEYRTPVPPEACIAQAFRSAGDADPLAGMITADVNCLLPDDFLLKVDRASMAYGLEVRPPLVDHELLELAAGMPRSLKIRDGNTKWMLQRIYGDRLPGEITARRKQGFEIPTDQWLRGPLREAFESLVLATNSRIGELLDQSVIGCLYREHLSGWGRNGNVLWSILVLARWAEVYLAGNFGKVENSDLALISPGATI